MRRYVVTGGAGFIGSHLAEALVNRGDAVVVLDDLSSGKPENLAHLGSSVDLRRLDLSARTGLARHLAGVDTVFHQAAIPSVPASVEDPIRSHDVNVGGTLNLLSACRDAGVRRVVYASSCALYGDDPALPKQEDMPARPLSPYGAQKYIGEVYMRAFWRTYGLETVSLRYFNVFGPRQDAGSEYSGVIARFMTAVLNGKPPVVYGDGTQTRDFVYVANVVEANLKASKSPEAPGEVFNVATGERTAIAVILAEIGRITGQNPDPLFRSSRPGDIFHSGADIARARSILGWAPAVPVREGLERTIEWYRRAHSSPTGTFTRG
jgi:UDP-glucose 4-epimerase